MIPRTSAGPLRHRVQIQAATITQDPNGGPSETWATAATVHAAIEPLSGREFFTAQQVQAEVTHKITLRYYTGLTTQHRLKFGSRIFNITSAVDVSERRRVTEVMAREVV